MKRARILTTVSAGIICVFALGAIASLVFILANRYLQYGLYTLAALSLERAVNVSVAFYFGTLLVVYLFWLVFTRRTQWERERFFHLGVAVSVIFVALLTADRLLKEFTGKTLLATTMGYVDSLGEEIKERLLRGFLSGVSGKHLAILILFAGGVIAASFVRWLFKRIGWEKVADVIKERRIRGTALILVILWVVLNMGVFIFSGMRVPEGPNIILIAIDCLRPDHLGSYGYGKDTSPHIDGIARDGLVFENAYSNAPWTKPSVASIFTALHPTSHTAINKEDILPYEALTIAEILKNGGYYTLFLNGGNYSIDTVFNFQQGFDFYACSDQLRDGSVLTDLLLARLSRLRKKKFFAYLHYMDTHLPYQRNKYTEPLLEQSDGYLEPGDISPPNIRKLTSANRLSDEDRDFLVRLYDGQIRYVDESIGRILSFLKDNNLLQDTVIVVTADHGEEFWEHSNFEHGHTLYEELIRVPLIMSGDGLKHGEVAARVRLIDLLPTILHLANVETVAPNQQGVDFLAAYKQGKNALDLPVFATGTLSGNEKYCIIQGALKLIVNTDERDERKLDLVGPRSEERYELYDLDRDPRETENLKDDKGGELARLQDELARYVGVAPAFRGKEHAIEGELREKLKALGYVQ